MSIIIFVIIAIFFASGIFNLMGMPSWTYRLQAYRTFVPTRVRDALLKASTEAGKTVRKFRTAKRQESVQKELYSALSILRNYASETDAICITTDYLFEQFSQTDGTLKEAYAGALRLLRAGRRHEAADFFTNVAGIELARDFILLVLDWDAVPPSKLKQAVSAFQNALKETRTTELMRKTETMSDLVYLPVILGVLVVFVNFVYVAYFAEQRTLLAELFF